MMKRHKMLFIPGLLALLSAGLYCVVAYGMELEENGRLFALEPQEISEINLENQYGSYDFSVKEGEWIVSTSEDYRTNKKKMDMMLEAFQDFTYSRILEEDNGQYGLEKPLLTLEILDTAGKSYSFTAGNTTASQNDVYFRDERDGQIYVVGLDRIAQLTGSLGAYRDNEIFTVDISKLSAMEYFQGEEKTLALETDESGSWKMRMPYQAQARNVVMNEILAMLDSWIIADYPILTQEDYARAGLEAPEHTLVLSDTDGNTQRIAFGNELGSKIAVQTGADNEVVTLFAADVDFSQLDKDTLVYVAPLKANMEHVETITVEGDWNYEFQVDVPGTTASCNGRMIDFDDFTGIYYKYVLMIAQGGEEAPVARQSEPVITLSTVFSDGSQVRLELYERDQDTYYMGIDGQIQFYMEKSRLEEFLKRVEQSIQ